MYRAMMRSTYIRPGPSCPTSRAPKMLGAHAILRSLAGVGAVCRAIPRGQAGVGVGRQRHQGDIEEALRRRRWWRRGGRGVAGYVWPAYEMACFLFHVQWTSSCDHAVTSSAVLYRTSYDVGVGPQLQFIDRVFLPRCEQRQVPTVLSFQPGFVVFQYIDKVVDVWGTRLLYGGF